MRQFSMLFKLYPWEWMIKDAFAQHIIESRTQLIEPAWKMLLSNKGILGYIVAAFPRASQFATGLFKLGRNRGTQGAKATLKPGRCEYSSLS